MANVGDFKIVPRRKLAIIEHVSIYASGLAAKTADYFITSTIGDNSAFREVPIVTTPGGTFDQSGAVLGSHPVRAFAKSRTQFGAVIRRIDTTEQLVARFVLAGHYLRAR
jgi:hypothetical protein